MRWIRRIVCVAAGHRWEVLRRSRFTRCLQWSSWGDLIGCDAICKRCGAQVLDYERHEHTLPPLPW